jgi:hypothetical protein
MSAFVHPENQKIIWNIVNSNQYVNAYFNANKNVSKEAWFRGIIEKFYSQHQDKNLSMPELNQLNKDALSFMIQSIHNTAPVFQNNPTTNQNNYDMNPIQKTEILTPPLIQNTREQQSISAFNDRQQEYQNMMKKNVPQEIDFKEGDKDEAIQNMDDLIKQHMKEREEQLQMVPPVVQMPNNNVETIQAKPNSNEQNNSSEIENIKKDIQTIMNMLKENNELLLKLTTQKMQVTEVKTSIEVKPETVESSSNTDENIKSTIIEEGEDDGIIDVSMNIEPNTNN